MLDYLMWRIESEKDDKQKAILKRVLEEGVVWSVVAKGRRHPRVAP